MDTYRLTLPGPMLRRGFWLYVWRVSGPDGKEWLYVGRTGDNSSPNASPPYIRMGQHLGSAKNQNSLRRHLHERGISPEECREFHLVAHGPIHPEVIKPAGFSHKDKKTHAELMEKHVPIRNVVGAMEKQLAKDLRDAGYQVLNNVSWKHSISEDEWEPIRAAFAKDFGNLVKLST